MINYTTDITINVPREKVIELFDNAENIKKWQPEFQSSTHISGEPGQEGAKSLWKYTMNNKEVEMEEVITKRNFPDSFEGKYTMKGTENIMKQTFIEVDENTTKWESYNEFHLSGFMKLMSWFMPKAMKKGTDRYMKNFKEFAESAVKKENDNKK